MIFPQEIVKIQGDWIVVAHQLRHNTSCRCIHFELPAETRENEKQTGIVNEAGFPRGPPNVKSGLSGITRIIAATVNSLNGIRDAFKYESAFRQNVALSVVLLFFSVFLAQTVVEWLLLVMPLLLLIIVELLNSAIENTVDRIGAERHILSGRAKDMGSAAVLICHVMITTVWLGIIWSRYFA